MFYPKGLPHARELAYAGEHLTSIEINGTFYRTQTPATFRKWASEVPDGFVFSLKGPRYAVNRRVLSGGRRLDQTISRFRRDRTRPAPRPPALAIRAVQEIRRGRLRRLPRTAAEASSTAAHCAMSSRSGTTASRRRPSSRCCANSTSRSSSPNTTTIPAIADVTGDFVYARLQKGDEKLKAGYPPKALDAWAARAKTWAKGGEPKDLPRVDKKPRNETAARRFHLFHPRGEIARAGGRHGADRND